MVRARSEGSLRLGTLGEQADAFTRSHLSDGSVVGWHGGIGVVIDAELVNRPVPRALGARFGAEDFWARWTRAECAAKLANESIVIWLRHHGLTPGPYSVTTLTDEPEPGIVVTLGRKAPFD